MAPTDRRRLCKFRLNWLAYDDFWAWLTPVKSENHKAFCNLCKKVFNIGHGGVNDVKAHAKLKGHSELREQQQQTHSGNNFTFDGCLNTTNVIYNPETHSLEDVESEPQLAETQLSWDGADLVPGSPSDDVNDLNEMQAREPEKRKMSHTPNSKMSSSQEYCLRWKYHHSNLQMMFSQLLERECYTDVTLACEGKTLRAHKMVLSACSTYFHAIFSEYAEKNPIVILKDVKYADMKALVTFMYRGEINVHNSHLTSLLKTAEDLRIKGLAQMTWRTDGVNNSESNEENSGGNNWRSHSEDGAHGSQVSNGLPQLISEPGGKRKRVGTYSKGGSDQASDSYSDSVDHITHPQVTLWTSEGNDSEAELVSGEHNTTPPEHSERNYSTLLSHLATPKSSSEQFGERREEGDSFMEARSEGVSQDAQSVTSESTSAPPQTASNITPSLQERFRDVIKMNDYLVSGRRPQFWEEPFTRNVMEAIKAKEIEMKCGAEILGVSYGTLYGRYREAFGCLKHPYRVRDFWSEQGPSEVLAKLQRKEITLFRAAEILNVTVTTLANYLSTLRQDDPTVFPNTSLNDSHCDDSTADTLHDSLSYTPSGVKIKQESMIGMVSDDEDAGHHDHHDHHVAHHDAHHDVHHDAHHDAHHEAHHDAHMESGL